MYIREYIFKVNIKSNFKYILRKIKILTLWGRYGYNFYNLNCLSPAKENNTVFTNCLNKRAILKKDFLTSGLPLPSSGRHLQTILIVINKTVCNVFAKNANSLNVLSVQKSSVLCDLQL